MNTRVATSAMIAAASVFASVWQSAAQEQPSVRPRRQASPGMSSMPGGSRAAGGAILRPQMNSPRFYPQSRSGQFGRPGQDNVVPVPTSSPRRKNTAKSDEAAAETARSPSRVAGERHSLPGQNGDREKAQNSPARRKSNGEQSKHSNASRSEHAETSDGTRGEHKPTTPERREPEHTIVIPTRTPPVPVTTPVRPPEAAPVMPSSAPPVVAPAEHLPQGQAQMAQQQRAPVLNDLSQDERTRLQSAHDHALHDPNLAATRARYLDARKEYRQKLRDALLKADPSVQPILDKIHRDKPEER